MYLRRNQITASVFLLLVAMPVVCAVGLLVKQKILHYQREKKFEKETLQTVVVPAAGIYWVKPGKEILVEGKLFDVKSYAEQNGKISLLGFFDHKEDKVVQEIVMREKQKQQNESTQHNPAKFFFFPVYIAHEESTGEGNWRSLSHQFYHYSESIPASPGYPIIHPPQL
jgi:hypothetical protein